MMAAYSNAMASDLDVVMVVHDRKEMAFEGIELLLESPLVHRIVVVDNASKDGLESEGPSRYPSVHWIRLEDNRGCIAWNRGMEAVEAPLALILDDDCVPDLPSLAAARERMQSDSSVGLAAFNILHHLDGRSEWGPFEKMDGSQGWANAIGACMLVRTQAFREVGGYRDFFLCFNDLELVLSLWKAGWRVVYDQAWRAHHKRAAGPRPRRFYWELRNFIATAFAHFGLLPASAVSLNYLVRALSDAKSRGERREALRGAREGIAMGFRLRREQSGRLPPRVKRLFYANFLLGSRSAGVGR
jgi:GT2 family glycosyltransferase